MAFSDFTLPKVQAELGLTITTAVRLFGDVPPASVTPAFRDVLLENSSLATLVNTEKARSELLIAPLLSEVWRRAAGRVSFFSGLDFNFDAAAGLNGYCDFLLGHGPQLPYVTAPVLVVVEAKNESISGGLGQCAAEMVAVHRFNQREGVPRDTVYGAVTTGSNWRFLSLRPPVLTIDVTEYLVSQADQILGILLHMLRPLPQPVAA
jgi:hypothetical protein